MLSKNTIQYYLLLVIFLLSGNLVFQLFLLGFFGIIILLLSKNKILIDERFLFYSGLCFLSATQFLLFFDDSYSLNYNLNSLIAFLFWFLALLAYLVIKTIVINFDIDKTKKLIDIFFIINFIIIIVQLGGVIFATKTLNPFASTMYSYGQSTGDHLKGVFSNSSISMIIMSFYTVFYAYKRNRKVVFAIIAMLLSTYMSGVFIFSIIASIYVFFTFGLKTKIKIVSSIVIVFLILTVVTPTNISYVKLILTENLSSNVDPPRKMISFWETLENWTSSPKSFIYGEGAGKFSSRTAFLTAGDYTDWFPKDWEYKSEAFSKNHFPLWNKKILSIAYKDGTHNQPFSFYNQIIGEFGLMGLILFGLYMFYMIKNWYKMTYGRILMLSILGFFVLDYWFDYFSVILFLELFINLNIKEHEVEQQLN
ncbi:hypothetical protein [Marixanthomonas spongiae]|uniref:O-antigen ligase family protein n=1 Tax=Marixanthomonas spongiae TaxID=2174845 RepID=A0A2U0I211_9FLAO|nr:hypothetical protein [Marixanthomonas spongiae]PVW15138.1 hypothetical protein DDV96_06940 [Marixanthomonas spongiae]